MAPKITLTLAEINRIRAIVRLAPIASIPVRPFAKVVK